MGSLGGCHLPSDSGRVIEDCSHMMTYDLSQVQSSSPEFQMVLAFGQTQSFVEKMSGPVHRLLLWLARYEFFSGRKFMSGCLFFTKRILNLPPHSVISKVNGFFYYQ